MPRGPNIRFRDGSFGMFAVHKYYDAPLNGAHFIYSDPARLTWVEWDGVVWREVTREQAIAALLVPKPAKETL